MRAVEEKKKLRRRARAIERLLALRAVTPPVTEEDVRAVRHALRS